MALPLLMMAGAGILGGAQFLMKKADERQAESLLGDLQARVNQSQYAGTQMAQDVLAQGQRMAGSGSWLDTGNAQRVESLLDAFTGMEFQQQQAQMARQQEMADAYSQSNLGIARNLEQGYNESLRGFAEVQTQFRAAMTALENPSNLNSVTTLYNLFNILEPGGRVTQNEDGTFSGAGDIGNRAANWLNEWKGQGLTEKTRREIADAIWSQYTPRLERSREIKQYYENEIQALAAAGRIVRSPVGSLGINWGVQQMPDFRGAGGQGGGLPVPPGYSVVN